MEPSSLLLKIRTAAFSLMMLTSLSWSAVLIVELFLRWDISDKSQRDLVLILILINSSTSIMLPVLLIMQFKVWWDGVRVFFLLIFHIGTAVLFTVWNPTFLCSAGDNDCRRVNMYILVGSWINPALLLLYLVCLTTMLYWRKQVSALPEKRVSELPMMSPPPDQLRISSKAFTPLAVFSGIADGAAPSLPFIPVAQNGLDHGRRQSSQAEEQLSPRSSGRLSKRLPKWFY